MQLKYGLLNALFACTCKEKTQKVSLDDKPSEKRIREKVIKFTLECQSKRIISLKLNEWICFIFSNSEDQYS